MHYNDLSLFLEKIRVQASGFKITSKQSHLAFKFTRINVCLTLRESQWEAVYWWKLLCTTWSTTGNFWNCQNEGWTKPTHFSFCTHWPSQGLSIHLQLRKSTFLFYLQSGWGEGGSENIPVGWTEKSFPFTSWLEFPEMFSSLDVVIGMGWLNGSDWQSAALLFFD